MVSLVSISIRPLLRCTQAAYQVGLTFITESMRRALNSCVSPEKYFAKDRRVDVTVQIPVAGTADEEFDPLDLALEAIMG